MSRKKKETKYKKRDGVYVRKGWLYYALPEKRVINGKLKTVEVETAAHLKDTPENRKYVKELRNKLYSKNNTIATIDRNITLGDYAKAYLEEKKRSIENTTQATYSYNIDRICAFIANVKVRDITKKIVEKFLDDLFIVRHLEERTVEDTKAELNRICKLAVEDGILLVNPVPKASINKNLAAEYTKNIPDEEKYFSLSEATKFLKYVKEFIDFNKRLRNDILYEMFFLIAFFGLRREEILGLRWSAININREGLYITHTVTRGTKVNRKDKTKTKKSKREYPLPEIMLKVIKKLKEKEELNRKKYREKYKGNEYIFKQKNGTLFDPGYPTSIFKDILRLHPDLPQHVSLHGLRSSCVSILLGETDNPKEVSEYVGHEEITTTLERYAKIKSYESKLKLTKIMESLLPYEP